MTYYMKKNMFLRLYEKKTEFRYLFKKGHYENELQKEVCSCVEQRFNGFHIIMHMCDKTRQVQFESVDIVYKPVKRLHEIVERYFTNEINQAFIVCFQNSKNDILHSHTGFACYYCANYCITKSFFDKHLLVCEKKMRDSI